MGLVVEVAEGGVWILVRPDDADPTALLLRNYWAVIAAVEHAYAPAVVERLSAVYLHTDNVDAQPELSMRHGANASRRTLTLVDGYTVRLTPGDVGASKSVTVQGAVITLDSVARTLVQLNAGNVRRDTPAVALWLRHAAVTHAELAATYAVNPRPVLLKRMGLLARASGNRRLADLVETVLAEHAERPASASATGVGRLITIPVGLETMPRGATAWLDRHSLMMAEFRTKIAGAIGTRSAALPRASLARVLRAAKAAKAYDAYHSTTIEGYRITREQADAIVAGRPLGDESLEGLRERAALVGYSAAFDEVTRVMSAARGPVRIDEALIFDLYEALFSPSVDAGLLGASDLRQWRRQPAYIRGSPHVPPAEGKLPQLMSAFVESINQDLDKDRAVERAVLAHLDFVTIHPFVDGNGRIGRFLMNIALVGAGLPWVTIRADQRDRYFAVLRQAQPMDADPIPFARFVFDGVRAATRAITGESTGRQ